MLRLLASLLAILGAGDHHPAKLTVSEPLPFEVWDGRLAGRAARAVPCPRRRSPLRRLARALRPLRRTRPTPRRRRQRGHARGPPDPRLWAAAGIAAPARPAPQRRAARPGAPLAGGPRHGRRRRLCAPSRRRGGLLERRRRVRGRLDAEAPDHGGGARADRRRAAGDGVLDAVHRHHALLEQRRCRRGARAPGWKRGGRVSPDWSRRCGGSACATPTCTAAT